MMDKVALDHFPEYLWFSLSNHHSTIAPYSFITILCLGQAAHYHILGLLTGSFTPGSALAWFRCMEVEASI
jgi:hypothetical protein